MVAEIERDRIGRRLRTSALLVAIGLMLSGCFGSGLSDMTGSLGGGMFASSASGRVAFPVTMFVASTRKDDRAGAPNDETGAHFALNIISVPPGHQPGKVELPSFGGADSRKHFVLATHRSIDPDEFQNQIATYISGRVGANRDILLYVHGFNTSEDDARFRLAQIVADGRFGGLPVLFTWPSQANIFSYVSAKDSATASRDALERLVLRLAQTPGVGRVHVLAHSMGTWLAMEALRENAIAGHPDLDGHLGDVMLAAPDIDLAVFRQQMARLGERAHVSVFVSSGDRALALSSRIAGERPRVGAMDPSNPRDRADLAKLGVRVYDLSSFSDGFIGHGAYADAPAVIRTIGAQLAAPAAGDADKTAVLDAGVDRAPVQAGVAPVPGPSLGPLTQPSSQLVPRAMVSQPTPPPAMDAGSTAPNAVVSEPLPPPAVVPAPVPVQQGQ